ncbi:RsiV family protein [Paenibacillus sp. MSJ-34]|nr:RsiV family protein [Paenibacillus sp. MSJ-34]CAH0119762.1 hypothetical protein PAE9249_02270 [Paenibacillus sp. CECT 9249]
MPEDAFAAIVIVFNEYDVASGYMGTVEFVIPTERQAGKECYVPVCHNRRRSPHPTAMNSGWSAIFSFVACWKTSNRNGGFYARWGSRLENIQPNPPVSCFLRRFSRIPLDSFQ